jgi:PAS domain S-box-containing protein
MGSWGRASLLPIVSTLGATLGLAAPAAGGSFTDPDYLIDVWETEQGLPENSATAMAQTPDGYLWFGTFNGLVRFDGVEFTVFDRSNTPELPSPGIVNLHLDRHGRLWVSTMLGLASVKDGRWASHQSNGWVGNYVRFFVESAAGELYATTFDGKILHLRGEGFEELPAPAEPKLGFLPHVDRAGALWVIHPQYIGKWAGGRWQETIPIRGLVQAERGDEIGAGTARDGGLWIATRQSLRKYRDGRLVAELTPPWPMEGFWSVDEDSTGTVWICSHKSGVYRVAPGGHWRHFTTGTGLTYHAARFAFEDREGNTWIGTSGGGLMRFKPRHFVNWGEAQGLPERVVKSLSADRRGRIAMGTNGQGVVWLEGGRFRPIDARGGRPGIVPIALTTLVDRRDRLWVGSLAEGLHLVEGGTRRAFFTGGLPGATGSSAYSLFEDEAGAIWIGLDDGDPLTHEGVTRYAEGRFRAYPLEGSARHNTVHCFAQGPRDGTLWAGTHAGGLYRLDGLRFVPVPEARALAGDRLSALLADEDGTLWIGTEDGGIACLRGKRLVRISEAQGLPTRRIASIVDDGQGHLWLGSNRGVLRLARSELEALVDGRARTIASQTFNLSDGLATVECTIGFQPNAVRAPDGRLWFATYKGALAVDPRTLRLNSVPPPVLIEEVLIDGRPAEGRGPFMTSAPASAAAVTVPPGAKRLEIHYAGLSFTAPEKVRFRYFLEGLDRDWIEVGDRRVAYLQDLNPGSYRFRVQAANNDGVWNEAGTSVTLAVQPFLWQTLWFRSLALLGLLGVVVLAAVRVTRSRLQLRIARLEAEQAGEKYRKIFENAVEGIFQTDPSGRFLAVNPALGYILGYGPTEALMKDAVALDDRLFTDPACLQDFKRSLEERGYVQGFAARVFRRDRTPIWLSLNARAVRDARGAVLYYEGTVEDVTERRRGEEVEGQLKAELEKAAAEWERTFDSMETPIVIADEAGRVFRLNRAARELADAAEADAAEADAVVGRALADLGPGQPWQTAAQLAALVGQKRTAMHAQVRDPLSGRTWELSAGPSAGPAGYDKQVIVVARDMTQMIELQDSVRRSETMSAMGSLVAGVAHEVRNPLFSISANLDSFEATMGTETLFHPLISLLRAEVNRLTALMQGLLDYGKPIETMRSPGLVDAVIAEAVETCARLAASREVKVENEVGPGLPPVLMDRKRLVQVFQNILQNAIQHAPGGSVVSVDARKEGGDESPSLVLTVSDRGPGLGAEDLPRLFEPFFTRRRGGTGLGLAIVQRIVEEHGGTVSAANRPEGGAAISVRLACVGARGSRGTIAV